MTPRATIPTAKQVARLRRVPDCLTMAQEIENDWERHNYVGLLEYVGYNLNGDQHRHHCVLKAKTTDGIRYYDPQIKDWLGNMKPLTVNDFTDAELRSMQPLAMTGRDEQAWLLKFSGTQGAA